MQLTRPGSQQDVDQFQAADAKLQAIGIDTDSPAYTDPIINYLNQNPAVPITADNIVNFVNQNKNLFTWRTATEKEYDALAVKFTEPEKTLIARSLKAHGYWEGEDKATDQDLVHWNLSAKAHLARYPGQPVTADNIRITIGHLLMSPQGHLFVKKGTPSRFDSAAAQKEYDDKKKAREDGKNIDQRDQSQAVVTYTDEHGNWVRPLSGELKAHQDQVHAALKAKEDQQTNQADDPGSYYKQRSLDLLNSIQSNVDRQDATNKFVQHGHSGAWPWKVVFTSLNQWVELRKYQRSVAGRM
jgi:hypothetical protein